MGKYTEALKKLGNSVEYHTQAAMRRFVTSLIERMERSEMSRAKLAESLHSSPSYVSRVLRGDVNFTLETMTKLAMATGGRLDVRIVDSNVTNVVSTVEAPKEDVGVLKLTKHNFAVAIANRTMQIEPPANEDGFVGTTRASAGSRAKWYEACA